MPADGLLALAVLLLRQEDWRVSVHWLSWGRLRRGSVSRVEAEESMVAGEPVRPVHWGWRCYCLSDRRKRHCTAGLVGSPCSLR